jgi:CysZ protein
MSGLAKGLMAPFRGFFFLWGTPGLRSFIFLPGLIQLGVFVGLLVAAVFGFAPTLLWLLPESWEDSTTAQITGGIVLAILMLAAVVLFTSVLAGIIAAPILDVMSEKILREKLGPSFVPAPGGVWRSLKNQIGHMFIFLLAEALMLGLTIVGFFIPVLGSLVASIVSLTVTGYLLCVNHIDYPMGIAGSPWGGRYSYFVRRLGLGIGFGMHLFFLQFIPFSISASVAGACLLYAEDRT